MFSLNRNSALQNSLIVPNPLIVTCPEMETCMDASVRCYVKPSCGFFLFRGNSTRVPLRGMATRWRDPGAGWGSRAGTRP